MVDDQTDVGQPDPECGQHAGEGMDLHSTDPESICNETRMLPAGATEADERVVGDVVSPLHRHLLDGVRHVVDGDVEESARHLGDLVVDTRRIGDLCGQAAERLQACGQLKRLIAIGTE